MTQADSVHSTPRKTAAKKNTKSKTADSAERFAERAEAYLALESKICDVANMATIATSAMMNSDGPATEEDNRLAFFAVYHLCDMIGDLREIYYGRGWVA